MRTIDSQITAAEASAGQKLTESVTVSNELLSFGTWAVDVNASLDTTVPQSYAARAGGTYGYATARLTDGTCRVYVMTLSNASHWGLTGGAQINSATDLIMRPAVFTDVNNLTWVYTAVASGSAVQVKRQQINGTTADPITVSLSNFGPTLAFTLTNTSSLVRRVETILPTDGGVIVVQGTHDFTNHYSTFQFWLILTDGSAVYQLDAFLQANMNETYTNWHAAAPWATYCAAIYNPTTNATTVIANGHASGQAIQFTIQNGVESGLTPVVPVDPTYTSAAFTAQSCAVYFGLYILCGRLVFLNGDGSAQAFDTYLTSEDAVNWSTGERNCFLTNLPLAGTMLIDSASTPVYLYYGGNLTILRATSSPFFGHNTATTQLAIKPTTGWSIRQTTNSPDTLNFSVPNPAGALSNSTILRNGAVVLWNVGQWGVTSPIGQYVIDKPLDIRDSQRAFEPIQVSARDRASKSLMDWTALVTYDLRSRDVLDTTLSRFNGMGLLTRTNDILTLDNNPIVKPGYAAGTPPDPNAYDVTLGPNGLQSKALNNPLFALADLADAPDAFMRATVNMPDTGDLYALPQFAFLLSATSDGSFIAVDIPKNNSWSGKTKPRILQSNIQPIDTDANTGGYNFPSRYQGLWYSNNYNGADSTLKWLQAGLEVPDHYTSSPAYVHAAGATVDYVVMRWGRRLRLHAKVHDFSPATCAQNATYTGQGGYVFTEDVRMAEAGQTRLGMAVNTDVWATQGAFQSGPYADKETSLTTALDYDDWRTSGTGHYQPVTISSVSCFEMPDPGNISLYACSSGFPTFTRANVDLSQYFAVGQNIMTTGGGQPHKLVITGFGTNTVNAKGCLICDQSTFENSQALSVGIRYGDYWAEAGSSAAKASGTSIWVDPMPIKQTLPVGGWGLFMSQDPTARVYDAGFVITDGTTWYRMDKAWDYTSPVRYGASGWKVVCHGNMIGLFQASAAGIPSDGRMIIEREIIRYTQAQYTKWAQNLVTPGPLANTGWITYIPTYYGFPAKQASPNLTIFNTAANQGNFGNIPNTGSNPSAGLLAEATSGSGPSTNGSVPNVYLTGSGTSGGIGYITVDTLPAGPVLDSDIITVSGRAQFGTKKVTHPSTSTVCYYPVPLNGLNAAKSFVTVSRFEAYSGKYMTLQDMFEKVGAAAGVRKMAFRNAMTSPYISNPWSGTLTTTPQALPLVENMADFVLDMQAYLDPTQHLRIDFRTKTSAAAYYRIHLWTPTTGRIQCGIETLSSDISTDPVSGFRWLECSPVQYMSPISICPNVGVRATIRVSCVANLIEVTVNGHLIFQFNTARYVHTDGTSYDVRGAYLIYLSYSGTVTGNTAYVNVPELWGEPDPVIITTGSTGESVFSRLCTRYHLKRRTTANGSVEVGTFMNRDYTGTYGVRGPSTHQHGADDAQATGMARTVGLQSGGYMDPSYIAANGFMARTSQTNDIKTTQQANTDAKLIVREAHENAFFEQTTGLAKLADQPEDRKTLAYTPSNGLAPTQSNIDCTISGLDWSRINDSQLQATYRFRGYVDW